jgi:hypothetical protein
MRGRFSVPTVTTSVKTTVFSVAVSVATRAPVSPGGRRGWEREARVVVEEHLPSLTSTGRTIANAGRTIANAGRAVDVCGGFLKGLPLSDS